MLHIESFQYYRRVIAFKYSMKEKSPKIFFWIALGGKNNMTQTPTLCNMQGYFVVQTKRDISPCLKNALIFVR